MVTLISQDVILGGAGCPGQPGDLEFQYPKAVSNRSSALLAPSTTLARDLKSHKALSCCPQDPAKGIVSLLATKNIMRLV